MTEFVYFGEPFFSKPAYRAVEGLAFMLQAEIGRERHKQFLWVCWIELPYLVSMFFLPANSGLARLKRDTIPATRKESIEGWKKVK
jgi:hypothetical protein